MVNKKYKVLRSRVYYGEVIIPKILGLKNNGDRSIYEYQPLRHILFELTDDGYAVDLLNRVNNYKVFEKRDDIVPRDIVVYHSICLDDVLDYLGYLEELGYQDIKDIRHELFSGHFASDNPEIFGLVETEIDGRKKFVKMDNSLVDQYFLRRFDDLRKRSLLEVFDGGGVMDPFKKSSIEKKMRLRINS